MSKSKIEWTDAVWNPTTGCSKVSAGCANCYAEREWRRLAGNPMTAYFGRKFNDVACHPERLEQPLRWKKPRKIFVNSMSDLFHESVPDKFIAKVFAIMDLARQHTYMVLTKRPERAKELLSSEDFQFHVGMFQSQAVREFKLPEPKEIGPWPLKNVWLGVSVENQEAADERIPLLLHTPAVVRFISAEPLLGSVDLTKWIGTQFCCKCGYRGLDVGPEDEDGEFTCPECGADEWYFTETEYHGALEKNDRQSIDWVIVGGESGPNARPMHPYWVRSLRDQCQASEVPFFFKQWGEWGWYQGGHHSMKLPGTFVDGESFKAWMVRVGKKKAGRELDGRTWDELPEVRA